jgi:hypothetical protein
VSTHGDTAAKCSIIYKDFCGDWDPATLASPHVAKLSNPSLLPIDVTFKQAKSLDVSIPLDTWGKVDDFIDNGIVIVPDSHQNRNRAIQAMLLAIHVLCRPLAPNEFISREDCFSLGKLEEEGSLSECLVLL